MSIEAKRGCGYRKVGGIYLVGDGLSAVCDRLPYPLEVCRVCGAGIKPSRGIQWLDGKEFFGGNCRHLLDETGPEEILPGPLYQVRISAAT